jgi:hypothetical protein
MAQPSQLTLLAARRRALVARSAELRQACALDLAQVRSRTAWFDTGFLMLRSGRAIWPMLTGVAGLVASRKKQGWLAKAARLASWIGLGKRVAGILRSSKSADESPG